MEADLRGTDQVFTRSQPQPLGRLVDVDDSPGHGVGEHRRVVHRLKQPDVARLGLLGLLFGHELGRTVGHSADHQERFTRSGPNHLTRRDQRAVSAVRGRQSHRHVAVRHAVLEVFTDRLHDRGAIVGVHHLHVRVERHGRGLRNPIEDLIGPRRPLDLAEGHVPDPIAVGRRIEERLRGIVAHLVEVALDEAPQPTSRQGRAECGRLVDHVVECSVDPIQIAVGDHRELPRSPRAAAEACREFRHHLRCHVTIERDDEHASVDRSRGQRRIVLGPEVMHPLDPGAVEKLGDLRHEGSPGVDERRTHHSIVGHLRAFLSARMLPGHAPAGRTGCAEATRAGDTAVRYARPTGRGRSGERGQPWAHATRDDRTGREGGAARRSPPRRSPRAHPRRPPVSRTACRPTSARRP